MFVSQEVEWQIEKKKKEVNWIFYGKEFQWSKILFYPCLVGYVKWKRKILAKFFFLTLPTAKKKSNPKKHKLLFYA